MSKPTKPQDLTLTEAARILAAGASRILAIALIAALAAGLITRLFIPPRYSSHITMYVYSSTQSATPGTITSSDLQAAEGLLETCTQILQSNTVLSSVCAIVDEDYPVEVDELSQMVKVEVLDDTLLLRLTVTTTEAARSKAIANAFAQVVPEQITGFIRAGGVDIVDHARMPREADEPLVLKHTLLAFFGVGLLACAVYLLAAVYDTSIRTAEDLERAAEIPVLGEIPGHLEPRCPDAVNFPGTRMTSESPEALKNAYARIRTNILLESDEACQVLLVTSALPGGHKSVTASNLASSFALLGCRTLVVDCDLRKGTLSRLWRMREQPSLGQMLSAGAAVVCHEQDGFSLLSAGEAVRNPSELLASRTFDQIMEELRAQFDHIILDAPAMKEVPDTVILARHADGILVNVPAGSIRPEALSPELQKLRRTNKPILGTVLSCTGTQASHTGRFSKTAARMRMAAQQ